jgi:hypothetical protein
VLGGFGPLLGGAIGVQRWMRLVPLVRVSVLPSRRGAAHPTNGASALSKW